MTTPDVLYHYIYRGEARVRNESLERIRELVGNCNAAQRSADHRSCVQFARGKGNVYTGLVAMEFALHDADSRTYTQAMDMLRNLPQVAMTFTDACRDVLVVVAAYCLPDGTLPVGETEVRLFHETAYMRASLYAKELLRLELLPCDDGTGHRVPMACDKHAWLNPDVQPMKMAQPQKATDESLRRRMVGAKLPEHRYDTTAFRILPGYDEVEMQMAAFQKCMRDTLEEMHDDADAEITALAERCVEHGIDEEFAIKRMLFMSYYREHEVLVRLCFHNVYGSRKRGEKIAFGKNHVVTNMLLDYMPHRYEFRRNEMTDSLEYREKGMYIFEWQPVTKFAINTITLEVQRLGIPVWDRDMKRYLESNFVMRYNPMEDYLLSARDKWDGRERISELAARVPNANPRWAELFHRWMLSAVSQWLGQNKNYGSTTVPMIVGAQGDGKSTFCRQLLPPELRQFYTDRIDFTTKKDAERHLSAFALINIDEYDSISPSQTAFLKHVLQKTNVMGRDPYAMSFSDHKRYAAFIATTNNPTPLNDPTGSRRYICIRTTGRIDNTTPIDYEQIYGQLAAELQRGERAYFDQSDETYIQECNKEFQTADALEDIIQQLFRKPETDDEGEWMTIMEIVKMVRQHSKVIEANQATYVRTGFILKRLGYQSERKASGMHNKVVRRLHTS